MAKPSFEDALDWAFSQIISTPSMSPTLDEQKAHILAEHQADKAKAVEEARLHAIKHRQAIEDEWDRRKSEPGLTYWECARQTLTALSPQPTPEEVKHE